MTHSSWKARFTDTKTGYTVLVPVPGDLPVFTKVALQTILSQNTQHMVEVLVIPDQPSREYREMFEIILEKLESPSIDVRLVEMSLIDKLTGKSSGSGNTYHFLQLINGIEHSKGSHLLFHDADLFLPPGNILRDRFEECLSRKLSVFAVNPRPGVYTEDCKHFVATWEMLVTREWLYRFKPYQMRGRLVKLKGKWHRLDTTHLAQFLSKPSEIQHHTLAQSIVHFSFVISIYRQFRMSSKPFKDNNFNMLLIRLLVDAIDDSEWQYNLPSLTCCINGLSGEDKYLCYTDPETAVTYPKFRKKLQSLTEMGLFGQNVIERIRRDIEPFDRKFNYIASA